MSSETERARAVLAGLEGPARAMPLVDLGEQLWADYVRTGVGSRAAHPLLAEVVETMVEAHGLFEPRDPMWRWTTILVGIGRCLTFSFHEGTAEDADSGIAMIEAELDAAGTPPPLSAVARVAVAHAALHRVLLVLQASAGITALLGRGVPTDLVADLDRSDARLRELSAERGQAQLAAAAAGWLGATAVLRQLLVSLGSPDPAVLVAALPELMKIVQDLQHIDLAGIRPGDVRIGDTEWTAGGGIPWPALIFRGDVEEGRRAIVARPPLAVDIDARRRGVRDLLGTDRDPAVDDGPYATAIHLLQAAEPPAWVDLFVSCAAAVVHSADPPTGLDRYLLAVALHLRGRWDDGGWDGTGWNAPGGTPDGDAQASARYLLDAAADIAREDPDGLPALVYAATLSPEGTLAELGARLAGLTADLRAVGASALRFAAPVSGLWWDAANDRFELPGAWRPARPAVLLGGAADDSQDSVNLPALAVADDDLEVPVAYVASLSQLRSLALREPRVPGSRPVFVVNPRGDRMWAAAEAMLLRRTFYPESAGFGGLLEDVDGVGTAEEIRAQLDASLLHVACGVSSEGLLELAGDERLAVDGLRVVPGGLAILPPDHLMPLAAHLVAAGFTGVIGWRCPVAESVAAVAVYLLHEELDAGRGAAEAVREVRRRLRNREVGDLPPLVAGHAERLSEAGQEDWRHLVLWGR